MIRLAVRVARDDAEPVLAQLLELAPRGLEEVDVDEGLVEYAVYGAPGELPALPQLRAAAGEALVEVRTSELADDWGERWKRFHRPALVGDERGGPRLYLRPPWEAAWIAPEGASSESATVEDVVIDPGQAFGTGAHATTRLCLELLLELARDGDARGAFVDVGCGSGVLAIAAAKLGWAPVMALDHEAASVAATLENARANGVAVDARRADLRREAPPAAPTIAANLLRPLLLELAGELRSPPRALIASGLLSGEADEAAAAFAAHGLVERARRGEGEWVALRLAAPEHL